MPDREQQPRESDCRSALVLVEPRFTAGADGPTWHGMAFAGGVVVNDIEGTNRAIVLEDCWDALAAAGIEVVK